MHKNRENVKSVPEKIALYKVRPHEMLFLQEVQLTPHLRVEFRHFHPKDEQSTAVYPTTSTQHQRMQQSSKARKGILIENKELQSLVTADIISHADTLTESKISS